MEVLLKLPELQRLQLCWPHPFTLADDWAVPEIQGSPQEGLVASGLQTLEVCGQALALLHL